VRPGIELVACADLDGPRAEALAAQHGIAVLSPDELIGGDAVGRGIGVADLADAISTNRPHRASAEQALHALETMTAFQRSSDSGTHVTLETTCERPEPLPTANEEVLF
jgi:predicted dehydrogenase